MGEEQQCFLAHSSGAQLGQCKDHSYLKMSWPPQGHSPTHFHLWVSPSETHIMAVVIGSSVTLPFSSPRLGFNATLRAKLPDSRGSVHEWE